MFSSVCYTDKRRADLPAQREWKRVWRYASELILGIETCRKSLYVNIIREINTLSQIYQASNEEQDQAIQKYLRLPAKKEYEPQRKQAANEVYANKKKFHQVIILVALNELQFKMLIILLIKASMSYFSSLNALQYKRQYMFVEPMVSFMHNIKLFFHMGTETMCSERSKLDEFLAESSSQISQ